MEETSNIQLITIFLSSHILEEVKIDLYSTDDTPLQYLQVKNYSSKTVKINKCMQSFYCTVVNSAHGIEEQFQCKIKELLKKNEKPTLQIEFESFKLSVTVQFAKQVMELSDNLKNDQHFSSVALCNLKRLQKKILKKIEVQQLKKPIKPKCKFTVKNSQVTKTKTNLGVIVDKQRLPSQKKMLKRTSKKLETTHKVQFSLLQPENNQNSENFYHEEEVRSKRGGKHKTLAYKAGKMFEEIVASIEVKDHKNQDLPMYDLILRFFNQSLALNKKIVNKHRHKIFRNSYNNLLQVATQRDLQMQNQVLNVIQSSTDYTFFSANQSKALPKTIKSVKNSPYKVSSIKSRKRKVY